MVTKGSFELDSGLKPAVDTVLDLELRWNLAGGEPWYRGRIGVIQGCHTLVLRQMLTNAVPPARQFPVVDSVVFRNFKHDNEYYGSMQLIFDTGSRRVATYCLVLTTLQFDRYVQFRRECQKVITQCRVWSPGFKVERGAL